MGSSPLVHDRGVFHIKQPNWPLYRFEWHPASKRVYLIRLWEEPLEGYWIADSVTDMGAAINTVLIFLRGYQEHQAHGYEVSGLKQ